MRQNGPSRLAVVSVWPLLPLLSRERTGHQHGLVVARMRLLPQRHDVADRLLELLLGQAHFARVIVQVPHQRHEQFPRSRIGRFLEGLQHLLGHVFLAFDDHPQKLRSPMFCLCLAQKSVRPKGPSRGAEMRGSRGIQRPDSWKKS
jgi:hypothetical protein